MKNTTNLSVVISELEYPCLLDGGGFIVLFTNKDEGVVVSVSDPDNKNHTLGQFSDDWDTESFKPVPKGFEVVLREER